MAMIHRVLSNPLNSPETSKNQALHNKDKRNQATVCNLSEYFEFIWFFSLSISSAAL